MAAVVKKQRKIRGGHRAHVKKLLAQVEGSIANFERSSQDKLSQQKIKLREKLDTLKTLDIRILELVDDENEDESIEHEVAEASKITPIPLTPSTSAGNISSSPQTGLLISGATAASNVEISAKLTKLEMKRLNGRPTEWQAFVDCFDSAGCSFKPET